MRATIIHGPGDIRVEDRDYPSIIRSTDAVVRVTASCVCGSDLWPYRGVRPTKEPKAIGHEFVGVVESIGEDVRDLSVGDFVIAPFVDSCGHCPQCLNGVTVACDHLAGWGSNDEHGDFLQGGQGEAVRVPQADGTLRKVEGVTEPDAALTASLLTLSDVMSTGHHAAVSANVGPGSTVVVVGDGAVGLCGVLAAKRLGAARIIAMSRHEDRQALAREFGATDIVAERGDEGVEKVRELLGGVLADSVLECVGTKESMDQALRSTRPGGNLGFVGVPAGGPELPIGVLFAKNITVGGGMAPAHTYIPELLKDVLDGTINPGRVFDVEMPLEDAAEAYRAMDERRAIKVLLKP
ncbi:zinc-dependent alcohol dehydrogenase family protein [Arthrobacter agilis]|uniref:zinc-dependent alcohol dehydrogenase family protein n=1 Tax=Arthrobacter agilis TaxID=37921 RepID=UPI000B34D66C|nr:zinc-dependent alcohol dehydrogenase family protein [Arthrobacter agilis]OUM40728.1 IMP dehydrogenase [Arthrobacter agilis]PPB45334.1 IMP dehydrogenase [Arthrobacter agilis]TPV28042.1 zinc-dependent alcohol dehydrogenase family protein [Arthrobacter agilis]WDF33864.1 zinc-dependent alcohol dehydrogenase family protein [Arthrobacter agilis]VDR31261.1 Formaldehyde dismutase [Arthrobacter agilis]